MQRANIEALQLINAKLTSLISTSRALYEAEAAAGHGFDENADSGSEFLSARDPSILHFLVASGDAVTSKALRDDLMTLLIAGHETTAAVLTWTAHLLSDHPDVMARVQAEVRGAAGHFRG